MQDIDKLFEISEEGLRNLFEWNSPAKGEAMSELKVLENSNLLTPKQAADYLGIKLSTIYSMCMKRQIPFIKIGRLNRFRTQDLNKWIESHVQRGLGQ